MLAHSRPARCERCTLHAWADRFLSFLPLAGHVGSNRDGGRKKKQRVGQRNALASTKISQQPPWVDTPSQENAPGLRRRPHVLLSVEKEVVGLACLKAASQETAKGEEERKGGQNGVGGWGVPPGMAGWLTQRALRLTRASKQSPPGAVNKAPALDLCSYSSM